MPDPLRPSGRNARRPRAALGRTEVQAVYRAGRRITTPIATVHVLRRPGGRIRVAIPVAKRLGSAVLRNRIRRRLRAAFDSAGEAMVSGADVVVVAKGESASAPFGVLVAALRTALHGAEPTKAQR